jgi:hypothetical protein
MQPTLPLRKMIFFAAVACATILLLYYLDDNMETGWPAAVVRNWLQFGFLNLHGQLVCNPGGFDIATHPNVYKGMSPVCLYPAFFASKIFQWAGLGTLPLQFFAVPILLWGIWRLLGRDDFAIIAAALAMLSPGYMRCQKMLETNTMAVLPVIPFAVIVMAILQKPKLTPIQWVGLVIFTLAFMSLNWSTGWIFAPCIFLLFGMPGVNRRALVCLVAVMAIGVFLVVGVSFALKAGGDAGAAGHVKALTILSGYLWGSGGYGEGLTTGRAFLRLAVVSGVGLLPLGLVLVYATAQRVRAGAGFPWFAFTPLSLTIMDIVIMRNYFGHHPPLAGPLLLVGLVFSLALLRVPPPEGAKKVPEKVSFKFAPALALAGAAYCLAVLVCFRANENGLLSVVRLVRQNTARTDVIVAVKANDPDTAVQAMKISEPLDRHVVVADDFQTLAGETNHWVLLTSVNPGGSFTLVAQSAPSTQSWVSKPGEWFSRVIAKRDANDRIGLSGTYSLYAPPVDLFSRPQNAGMINAIR